MMKYIIYMVLLFMIFSDSKGQDSKIDSLKQLLEGSSKDTNRVKLLLNIGNEYYFRKPDTSRIYSQMALDLARELDFKRGVIIALNNLGESSRLTGDYPTALKMQLEALELNRTMNNRIGEAGCLSFVGVTYIELREFRQSLNYLLPAYSLIKESLNPHVVFTLTNIGKAYNLLNMPDSALFYLYLADTKVARLSHPQLKSLVPIQIGNVFTSTGNKDSALYYYYRALRNSLQSNESINLGNAQQRIAETYFSENKYDSSLLYGRSAFSNANRTSQKVNILESSILLVKLYRQANKLDSAFYYEDIATATKESLYGPEKFKQLQLLMLAEQEKQQETKQVQERYKNKTRMIALWSAVGVFLIIAFILFRNNIHKQKANKILVKTLSDLKSTQTQLIQSEKMASLGVLTAGIAHEIQNPLNFVNNFSEVNDELLKELKTEAEKGNLEEVKAIVNDIAFNSEKINHHGKRADSIVKGMLQHSRTSTGQKELTDINALADEYLRLAYHGLRAIDKSFNATTKTEFDNSIGKISVVPQEIGRVILNLINNAFYAVDEKKKQNSNGYEPIVAVTTKKHNGRVEIKVADNGNGIPQKNLDKIFQPFFTTKPTGQGTGLGLSLAYDIITKGHGGELKVETKEGEGSEFIIQLRAN